jgi:hypothetical protein
MTNNFIEMSSPVLRHLGSELFAPVEDTLPQRFTPNGLDPKSPQVSGFFLLGIRFINKHFIVKKQTIEVGAGKRRNFFQ